MIKKRIFLYAGLTIMLMATLGAVFAHTVISQKLQAADYDGDGVPLLIEPQTLADWGKVEVFIPMRPIQRGEPIAPPFLSGWEEAYYTAMDITSPIAGQYFIMISSHSYKFTTPAKALAAFRDFPEPQSLGWLSEQPSALNPALADLLKAHSFNWRLWYGIDSEGFPTHILWLQSGPYIGEIYIFVAVPTFHKELALSGAHSEEQMRKFTEILQDKLEQGLSYKDLIDIQSSQALGQEVLNDVVKKLVVKGQ